MRSLEDSASTSSLLSARKRQMKKIVEQGGSESRESIKELCSAFETAAKCKPSNHLSREQSLQNLRGQLGYKSLAVMQEEAKLSGQSY